MTQPGDLTESAPPGFSPDEVMQKAGVENFVVASRLVPRRYREHLLSMYGYARFVDDIGDLGSGDRVAQLDWAETEISRAFDGVATHLIFVRAGDSARALGLDIGPFLDLISANRQDQRVSRYATFGDLEGYCCLSANPIGVMVLAIFDARSDENVARSNEACTALQIIEHLQDVGEDAATGRIYLPHEDLVTFGVVESDLCASSSSPALRRLVGFETARAKGLLFASLPLVHRLHGWARLAVAGFIGGGIAQVDALEAAGFDVLGTVVKASRLSVLRHTLAVYARAGRSRPLDLSSSPEVPR